MLIDMRKALFLSIGAFLVGCRAHAERTPRIDIPLQKLFDSATVFDQKLICSTGYLMIGESFAVYPTAKQANDERYQKAAILLFDDHLRPTADLPDLQKVAFCGKVDLQRKCWKPEAGRTFCVPFSKPIHVRVKNFEAVSN